MFWGYFFLIFERLVRGSVYLESGHMNSSKVKAQSYKLT